jgi:hypothetical protein
MLLRPEIGAPRLMLGSASPGDDGGNGESFHRSARIIYGVHLTCWCIILDKVVRVLRKECSIRGTYR